LKPVLVTGASGFLGWHVAKMLAAKGLSVRALVRNTSRLRDLPDVEPVTGDLRDAASVDSAAQGCGLIFHVAADYRLWSKDPNELYASNVEGTRNVLNAARKNLVDRVVYTSTVGCIGIPGDGREGNEQTAVSLDEMTGHYKRSKFLAEKEALRFAAEGLPVVIVNPTAPVGDHDFKPTPTGKIIVDFLQGKMPAYVDTGLNIVDASDTAFGHWLACELGRPGERYVLGKQNLTLREILETLARISGLPAPRFQVPYPVAYAAGWCSTAWANLTGSEPRAPLEGVRMARKKMWVTHEKATRELGFQPGSAEDALTKAVTWFQRNGYVQN
jgi:dihydroflavonol-4-reductase